MNCLWQFGFPFLDVNVTVVIKPRTGGTPLDFVCERGEPIYRILYTTPCPFIYDPVEHIGWRRVFNTGR